MINCICIKILGNKFFTHSIEEVFVSRLFELIKRKVHGLTLSCVHHIKISLFVII